MPKNDWRLRETLLKIHSFTKLSGRPYPDTSTPATRATLHEQKLVKFAVPSKREAGGFLLTKEGLKRAEQYVKEDLKKTVIQ